MEDNKNAPRQNRAKKKERQGEDKLFKDQFDIIYKGFFDDPQTMKMLSVKTDIDRANICWYCRKLRRSKKIAIIKKADCQVTKHPANYYTTNPDLFPFSSH